MRCVYSVVAQKYLSWLTFAFVQIKWMFFQCSIVFVFVPRFECRYIFNKDDCDTYTSIVSPETYGLVSEYRNILYVLELKCNLSKLINCAQAYESL